MDRKQTCFIVKTSQVILNRFLLSIKLQMYHNNKIYAKKIYIFIYINKGILDFSREVKYYLAIFSKILYANSNLTIIIVFIIMVHCSFMLHNCSLLFLVQTN